MGNQTAVTDTLGHVTRHWYDGANRLIATTANYSDTIYPDHGGRNEWNLTTAYGYDAVGNQTVVTDPSGVATYFAYDALGHFCR